MRGDGENVLTTAFLQYDNVSLQLRVADLADDQYR